MAAIKECENKEELDSVLSMFNIDLENQNNILKDIMGGKFFDLPEDKTEQNNLLKEMFILGYWRDPKYM